MMADASHLERMGRELKCPICLSLLNSAVSLTCNHVFCSSCIIQSMKLASSCPVCKVPYGRREIRPVPHMDNLVSVYKSMEASSGIDIFVTQDEPKIRLSDERQVEVEQRIRLQETNERAETERACSRQGSKRLASTSLKNSGSNAAKPSFPTKKRVQVPHNPLSEISLQDFEGGLGDRTKGSNTETNGRKELVLSPFFWLRGEGDEKSSQLTGGDHARDTPPLNALAFSDIKDSDDEMATNLAGEGKAQIASNIAECFESEMFEWTQRPCSPELCSSPSKMQVADREKFVEIQEMEFQDVLQGENKVRASAHVKTGNSKKRCGKAGENVQKKRMRKSKVKDIKHKAASNKRFGSVEVIGSDKNDNSLDKERACLLAVKSRSLNKDVRKARDLPSAPVQKHGSVGDFSVKNIHTSTGQRNDFRAFESIMSSPATVDKEKACNSGAKARKKTPELQSSGNGQQNGAFDVIKGQMKTVAAMDRPFLKKCHSHSKDLGQASTASKAPVNGGGVLRKCSARRDVIRCAFCHSAVDSEVSGEMIHYLNSKPVQADFSEGCNVIHSHRNCTEWAPNVYFEGDNAVNLESEFSRSRRIKCCMCGEKGAALGCYEKNCHRSFHFPCAKSVAQCRWDNDNYVMLCPAHASSRLPHEIPRAQRIRNFVKQDVTSNQCENDFGCAAKLILCFSGLTTAEREIVSEFSRASKASIFKKWDSRVTHVIASTDENGACKRTLKVLMGILEGKWILSVEWVNACMEAKHLVNEEQYEINIDVHGIRNGPSMGRLRHLNKQPKLFDGLEFYFIKDFTPSYKGYLHDIVLAAGGTVLHRKPVLIDEKAVPSVCRMPFTFIIYSLELPENCDPGGRDLVFNQRKADAEALLCGSGAHVASSLWLLNSVAGCKLQAFSE